MTQSQWKSVYTLLPVVIVDESAFCLVYEHKHSFLYNLNILTITVNNSEHKR